MFSYLASFFVLNLFELWVILELNIVRFLIIILIFSDRDILIKYFFVQALSSLTLIFFYSLSSLISLNQTFYTVIILAGLIKLGAAPFHSWFLLMINKMSWQVIWVFSTFQKLIPLILLRNFSLNRIIFLLVLMGGAVAIRGSVSTSNIKRLLGLSSVFSVSWLLAINGNNIIILFFLITYRVGLWLVVFTYINERRARPNSVFLKRNNILLFTIAVGLFSIIGFPPFLGFYIKLIITIEILSLNLFSVPIVLIIRRVVVAYIYIQIILFILLNKKLSYKAYINVTQRLLSWLLIFCPLLLLLCISVLHVKFWSLKI